MTAAEDYPTLAGDPEGARALAEISQLRGDVSVLLAKLASAETMLRIAADPNASLWKPPRRGSETS